MKTSEDVCYNRQIVHLNLTVGEFVSVEYWYLQTVRPNSEVQCYLWGNDHGDLPKYFNPDAGPLQLIQSYKVCCNIFACRTVDIDICHLDQDKMSTQIVPVLHESDMGRVRISVSPHKIYEVAKVGSVCLEENFCKTDITFEYHHEKSCR